MARMKKPTAGPTPDDLVRAAGLRRTPVRTGVLRVLAAAAGPLDVPGIVAELPDQTDAVTVYRTLNTFTRKGLVHRVRGGGDARSWRYALGRAGTDDGGAAEHRHPHFVCDDCGKLECLTDATVPAGLVRSLGVNGDHVVSYPEVVLHGLCPKCK